VASLVVAPLDWTCGSSSQTSNWRTTIWTDDDLTNVLHASGDGQLSGLRVQRSVGLASATTRVTGPINHAAAELGRGSSDGDEPDRFRVSK
jgi:hypothetical protein